MIDLTTKSFTIGSLFVIAALTGACGGEAKTADDDGTDPTTAFSSQGLTIEKKGGDQVIGFFEREGVSIIFDFYRKGAKHVAVISKADRSPLFESTVEDNVETTTLLGGQAKLVAPLDEAPTTREGEPAVFERFAATPEMKIVPRLKEALLAANVDRSIFLATEPEATTSTSPKVSAIGVSRSKRASARRRPSRDRAGAITRVSSAGRWSP